MAVGNCVARMAEGTAVLAYWPRPFLLEVLKGETRTFFHFKSHRAHAKRKVHIISNKFSWSVVDFKHATLYAGTGKTDKLDSGATSSV